MPASSIFNGDRPSLTHSEGNREKREKKPHRNLEHAPTHPTRVSKSVCCFPCFPVFSFSSSLSLLPLLSLFVSLFPCFFVSLDSFVFTTWIELYRRMRVQSRTHGFLSLLHYLDLLVSSLLLGLSCLYPCSLPPPPSYCRDCVCVLVLSARVLPGVALHSPRKKECDESRSIDWMIYFSLPPDHSISISICECLNESMRILVCGMSRDWSRQMDSKWMPMRTLGLCSSLSISLSSLFLVHLY